MGKTSSSSVGNYNYSPAAGIPAQAAIGEPEIHGVIPAESAGLRLDQALARLGPKRHQGRDAARAVLTMAALRARLAD